MRLPLSTRQAPLTTASMFTLLTTAFFSARIAVVSPATRPFSCFDRLRQAPVRSAEEKAAHLERQRLQSNAYKQQRYANDPEVRQKKSAYYRNCLASDPEFAQKRNVIELKAHKIAYREKRRDKREDYNAASIRAHAEDVRVRRSKALDSLIRKGIANTLTWRTHTCIRYPDPVAHDCTGCNRDRFLKSWWKEKPEMSKESGPGRYMCNYCFANDWPRVVPETYTGKLNGIFRSPEFPLTKAQRAELTTGKETESDKPQK